MTTEEVIRSTFGDAARYLSRDSCALIDARCIQHGIGAHSWCHYWRATHPPGFIYPNQAVTDAAWEAFDEWVADQKEYVPIMTALELDAFKIEAERAIDPVSFLTGEIKDVSPLVHYVMGRYLGYDNAVECWRQRAIQQLLELPWYRSSLDKMKKYLPEVPPHGPTF